MKLQRLSLSFVTLVLCGLLLGGATLSGRAQQQAPPVPFTQDEFVRLLHQLPRNSQLREELIGEIRRRGISFPLTSGLRSLVATRSGNDALLRRTLEEANRRRANPTASALPPEAEGLALLERARTETLAAVEAMPDFVVRQHIMRSFARGSTRNWTTMDRLTIAVSYREGAGEQYTLLLVNGQPPSREVRGQSYEEVGGTSSTGEFVSILKALFQPESRTHFQLVDTDTLRGRRTLVYEFEVQRENSRQTIKTGGHLQLSQQVVTGYRGRVWIDRENNRVLRIESAATEIPPDFPVTAAHNTIDYEWVTISDRQYLLPSRAQVELTARQSGQTYQARNEIRFRNYQRFGSEVEIIDDVDAPEDPPAEMERQPSPPARTP